MYMKFKDGRSKVLTLSYDDVVVQDIRLIGILDKYGIKGTFNINTGMYLDENARQILRQNEAVHCVKAGETLRV